MVRYRATIQNGSELGIAERTHGHAEHDGGIERGGASTFARQVLDAQAHASRNGTRGGTAQVGNVGGVARSAADVARKGADVRPLAHIKRSRPNNMAVDLVYRHEVGSIHLDGARWEIDILPSPGSFVRSHTVDGNRGVRRRDLLLLTEKILEDARGEEPRTKIVRCGSSARDLSFRIVGRGLGPNVMRARYRLRSRVTRPNNRVAWPTPTIMTPEASGSRVPA